MLGSPNGPAYGSRPKLVVMKVLCKLRWRKIRHPLIFPHSLYLHSFFVFLSPFLSLRSISPLLAQSFPQGVSFSLSPSDTSSVFHPLFLFLIYFTFASFRLSLSHHCSWSFASPSLASFFMPTARSASLTKIDLSSHLLSHFFPSLSLFNSLSQVILSHFLSLLNSIW